MKARGRDTARLGPKRIVGHNPTIDYLRLLAALPVVLLHAHAPFGFLSTASVGFFAMTMVWFLMLGLTSPSASAGSLMCKRGRRLLYPFVIWGTLQAGGVMVDAVASNESVRGDLVDWLPPDGHFAQLWFLPWAACICALLIALFWKRDIRIRGTAAILLALTATVVFSVACLTISRVATIPPLLELFIQYLPSVGIGMLFVALRDDGMALLACAAALVVVGLGLDAMGFAGTLQLTLATPLLAVALFVPMPVPKAAWAARIAPLAMNVYLVHVLVLVLAKRLLDMPLDTLAGGIFVYLLSICVALVIQDSFLNRWLK